MKGKDSAKGKIKSKRYVKLASYCKISATIGLTMTLFFGGVVFDNLGRFQKEEAINRFKESVYFQQKILEDAKQQKDMLDKNEISMDEYVNNLNHIVSLKYIENSLNESDFQDLKNDYKNGKIKRIAGITSALTIFPLSVVVYFAKNKLKKIEEYNEKEL